MADILSSDLSMPQAYGTAPNSSEVKQQVEDRISKDKNIKSKSAWEVSGTWFKLMGESSVASDFKQYLETPDFEPNDEYYIDDDVAMHIMAEHNIPEDRWSDIRNTKSYDELYFNIGLIEKDLAFQSEVDNSLTYDGALSGQSTASFAGTIIDDVAIGLISGGVGTALAGTAGLATTTIIMGADIGLETGLATARYMVKDNYDMNDAFTDMVLGLAPSAIAAYKASRVYSKVRKSMKELNLDAQKTADDFVENKPPKEPSTPTKATKTTKETPTPKHPEPMLSTVKILDTPSARTIMKRLNSFGIKNLQLNTVVGKIKGLSIKLKNAKTAKAKARLGKEISKLESTSEFKIVSMASQMIDDTEFIKSVKTEITDVVNQLDKTSANAIVKAMKKEMTESDAKMLDDIMNGKKVEATISKTFPKSKIATALALATIMPELVKADNGEDSGFPLKEIVVGIILGTAGYKLIKANGGVRQSAKNMYDLWKGRETRAVYEASDEASDLRKASVKLSNAMDTQLTGMKILFAGNDEALKAIDEMVGKGDTIDMHIRQSYESTMAGFNRSLRDNYEAWKIKNQDGTISEFNKLATDYIDNADNIQTKSKHIQKFVDDYHDGMERLYNSASQSGAKGFENLKYDRSTTPRLWRNNEMSDILSKVDKKSSSYKAIQDNLFQAFKRSIQDVINKATELEADKIPFKGKDINKVAGEYTKKFMNLWTDPEVRMYSKQMGEMDAKKLEKLLVKKGIVSEGDGLVDELVEAIIPRSKISSRAKRRVTFNPNYLEDIEISIHGNPFKMNKGTFVERDLMQIADLTSKEMSITTGYANKGYKTRSALYQKLEGIAKRSENPQKMMRDFEDAVKIIEGRPTLSNSEFVETFISMSRIASSIVKLPMVAFSTIPEFMNVISRSGLGTGMSALTKSMLNKYPVNGEVMKIRSITGIASFNDRLYRKGFIGVDELNDKLNPNQKLTKVAKYVEDTAYSINRLGWLTDVTQMAGIEVNLKELRKTMKDIDTGIPISRREELGITKKWIKEFRDDLLKPELDIDSWSIAKQDRFGYVMRSLNQTISPESMAHTRGTWMHTTSFGRAVSPLLNYSSTVMNEQGLPLLRHTDRYSVLNNINAIIGSYVGLNLKYAAEGKDVDQEDILTYAITGAPLAGGFGVARGILNPATLGTAGDIYNIVAPTALEAR